jgi:hypothetical protein
MALASVPHPAALAIEFVAKLLHELSLGPGEPLVVGQWVAAIALRYSAFSLFLSEDAHPGRTVLVKRRENLFLRSQ